MVYRIEIVRSAQKQVLAFPLSIRIEIAAVIDELADVPRPKGCKKLRSTDLWRIRIGNYRVIYAIDDKMHLITILKIAVRNEDTYQGL